MNLNSVLIGSERPEALTGYYTGLFGQPQFEMEGFVGWQLGSGWLTVGPHDQVHGRNPQPGRLLWNLETADVAGTYDQLVAAGAIEVRPPYQPAGEDSGWIATLADPDDNYFQLMSPMEMTT
ncbi:MAG TPA: VOC family protein [Acidimicrobiia bacterium]|nr:VOC family protein [Acidimicrobiia bacterium]